MIWEFRTRVCCIDRNSVSEEGRGWKSAERRKAKKSITCWPWVLMSFRDRPLARGSAIPLRATSTPFVPFSSGASADRVEDDGTSWVGSALGSEGGGAGNHTVSSGSSQSGEKL